MSEISSNPGLVNTWSPDAQLLRRVLRQTSGLLSMIWLGIIAFTAVFANLLARYNPRKADINGILTKPGWDHWFGADSAGRDVLSRLLFGSRPAILATLLCLAVAMLLGVTGGLVAGYFGGWFDATSSWLVSMIMAMPGIVVLIAVRAVLAQKQPTLARSIWVSMAVFGVLISPQFFRLVHVTVRGVRNELYVDAARVSGLTDRRIMARHILRVVRGPIILQAAIFANIAIAIQAALAILNFGDPDSPTWGSVLGDGIGRINRTRWLILWPSLTLVLTTLALASLANVLRDELELGGAARPPKKLPPLGSWPSGASPLLHPVPAATAVPPLLSVRDLTVGYPMPDGWKRVVSDVDLDVARGEVVGLVGESGSGKTQTAFAVLGLLPMNGRILGGSITFDGTELVGATDKSLDVVRGRRIAYVPQEPMANLDPSFTVGSQLTEPLRQCLGLSKAEARTRALELLARVGIPDPLRTYKSYPHELSGGMAQRVLIAGAVSCEPDLLIADEPTTALDVTVQAEILDLLRELQQSSNMALLLVTHNFGVVADLCDRVAVMQNGQIVESGPIRSIFREPKHEYTKSLLEAILEDAPARAPYAASVAS